MASLHSGDIASSLWVCRIKGPDAHRSPLKGVCLALHRLCSRTQLQRAHGLDHKQQDSMSVFLRNLSYNPVSHFSL